MDTETAVTEWAASWARVWELVDGLDDDAAGRRVPACPDWSVRDLVSHMVGLVADVLNANEPGDHGAAWTAAQVDARRGRDLSALRAEWGELEQPMADWMRANTTRPLGDVVIHEQDLRGALGRPGARSTEGLHALRDRMAGGFREAVRGAGLEPAALVGESWTFCTDGEPADAGVVLRASDFDLVRALMTRRSERQLRSWAEGDVAAYLPCFNTLGPLPEEDLTDGDPA